MNQLVSKYVICVLNVLFMTIYPKGRNEKRKKYDRNHLLFCFHQVSEHCTSPDLQYKKIEVRGGYHLLVTLSLHIYKMVDGIPQQITEQ